MTTWIEPPQLPVPEELLALVGGNQILGQVILRRGFNSVKSLRGFLDPAEYEPASAFDLPGMAKAVERILQAIANSDTICVWGDFDVDGQTSTALLVSALLDLGARVIFHIPVRALESHGVSWQVLEKILAGDKKLLNGWLDFYSPVSLLLTCDTGISAHAAVETAQARGIDVIISDHHELPKILPVVYEIINPQLLPRGHSLRTLPGVGVAYKLMEALYSHGEFKREAEKHLDLVALGIVADVAFQVADTRYLLQRGLQILKNTTRPGILAILEQAEIDPEQINEEIIAYEIAPRLNAIGRLGDANLAVKLLTTADTGEARLLATQFEIINNERRLLTSQVFQGALAQLDQNLKYLTASVIILSHPDWPAGILGIVASRLVERFHKPVILIATPEGGPGRASVRSIEGIHITQALSANEELLLNFGGHAMAAGFSIDPLRIDEFRRALDRTIQSMGPVKQPSLEIDGFIELSEITLDLVQDFELLAPYGAGNPTLVLAASDLSITNQNRVGRGGEHLAIVVEDRAGDSGQVIYWQGEGWPLPEDRFDLAFSARPTTYKGKPGLQLEWLDYRPLETTSEGPASNYRPVFMDHRQEEFPLPVLLKLVNDLQIQIWAEAEAIPALRSRGIAAFARDELVPGLVLGIWTSPPSPDVMAAVLHRIQPEQVYLFAVIPGSVEFDETLRRLAGLVKFIIEKRSGRVHLSKLAEGLAQTESIARRGLEWLAAKGNIRVDETAPNEFLLQTEGNPQPENVQRLAAELESLLRETRAYRMTYANTPIRSFLEYLE